MKKKVTYLLVRAAYEEGLNNINAATTTGDVTTAKDTAVQKSSTTSCKSC